MYLFLRWQMAELKAELLKPKAMPGPQRGFVQDEEAWPRDVREALASYPPELAEPTRAWIREQRRHRVDWGIIKKKVLSNSTNAISNNWNEGGTGESRTESHQAGMSPRHVVGERPGTPGITL